ncbi:substrate-binding domain-containing protein [Nocardiopsis sp. N85]|uniref:LacI family DNA-binding transcriptional regulator n=1 Tax=Nocardiopsis sp. N85 TaxID=3029400 RepID=UPI00237F0C9A|nr:substrate-binding domain-containing protein [Nocardiopsis sp. N85]MDE3723462.1 substrate-binding domain-containing protein [Nocardiopsis sp. N85]
MTAHERAGAVGLILARPPRLLSAEPFFMEFIAGIEERLADHDMWVMLHLVSTLDEEIAAYRRWVRRRVVDAVAVVNPTADDPRPALLRDLGLPFVVAGALAGADLPAVSADHAAPVREAVDRLRALGHRRIARVSGPEPLLHTRARTEALISTCADTGLPAPAILTGDYSHEEGERLTTALLSAPEPPTAILYDNDVMAVGGLAAARALGVDVPSGVSLVAWDDSTRCRLSSPTLTAMSVDVHRYGTAVAEAALEAAEGRPITERWSPAARFTPRGSTGPAPESI